MKSSLDTAASFLLTHAPLSRFFIFRADGVVPGVIHYIDTNGFAWTIMDDDDARFLASHQALDEFGAPVFKDAKSMNEYISSFSK